MFLGSSDEFPGGAVRHCPNQGVLSHSAVWVSVMAVTLVCDEKSGLGEAANFGRWDVFLVPLPKEMSRLSPVYWDHDSRLFLMSRSFCDFRVTEHNSMSICHEVAHSLLELRENIVSD